MLVASAMGPTLVRSSLEVMLDSLKEKDDKSKELIPALPARPISRGRLPPSRRLVPISFKIHSSALEDKQKKVEALEVGGLKPSTSPWISDGKKLDNVLRKGFRVWCYLPDANWGLGRIHSVSANVAHVKADDGKVLTVPAENILPANPDVLEGVGDLIQLSYLNEPSIIHNLRCRYSRNMIYANAGPVLVALNPYEEVPLYGNDFVTAYRQKRMDSPHVFATTEAAYTEMMRDGENQSIIISGESGAGKTETAKFAMQYLAAVGGGSGVEEKVLQANLILESFGNAKTLRNDNSSRFGKLIEIHFSTTGKICGANIQTYVLEKTRVVQRATGERSYHVFYQLCAGASPHLKEQLNLKAANEYEYLKQSNCLTIADIDDAQRFYMLMEALDIVKISTEDQENMLAIIATILWLGNIGFSVIDNGNHVEVDLSEGVSNTAKLMGCEVSDLMLALSTRKLKAGNECNVQKLTLSQAIDTRDSLAKAMYASLFDWLVEQLNMSLEVGKCYTGRSISILDIYGFESVQRNGFEQLCINYANERLQQHFNWHLLKLQQEEYFKNGIDWINVDFVDNTECINLFEQKPIGIFSLLDEESTSQKSTDATFSNKLKQHLSGSNRFKGESGSAFTICHFAGEVLYNTSGLLEKNRDLLHSDLIELLSSSCYQLPQLFASRMCNQLHCPVRPFQKLNDADLEQQTVGKKLQDQLFKLFQQLESTTPHFIRCIQPNSQRLPGSYEYDLVLQQVKCCGILEIVRILRLGYPTRMTHQQFAERYGFLLLRNVVYHDTLSVVVNTLQHFNVLPGMYQVGYTKIFFRAGQIVSLEETRHRTLQGILCVQKCFRGLKARRSFQRLKNGVILLQSFTRGWLVRKRFIGLQCSEMSRTNHVNTNGYTDFKLQDMVDSNMEHPQVPDTVVEELQRRLLEEEAASRIKEEENLALKLQIQQYETRWSDYEAKMKSMEEMWQKQMTSLQMSLNAVKKSHAADDRTNQLGRHDASSKKHNFDTEDRIFVEHHTQEGTRTEHPHASADAIPPANSEGIQNAVGHVVKEFEQQKKGFEDDARLLVEALSGQSLDNNKNQREELRELKVRFARWKKDYKVKMRETKAKLQRLGDSEKVETRKRWWSIRRTK